MQLENHEVNFLLELLDKDIIEFCLPWGIVTPFDKEKTISEFEDIAEEASSDNRDVTASEAFRAQDEYLYRISLKEKLNSK